MTSEEMDILVDVLFTVRECGLSPIVFEGMEFSVVIEPDTIKDSVLTLHQMRLVLSNVQPDVAKEIASRWFKKCGYSGPVGTVPIEQHEAERGIFVGRQWKSQARRNTAVIEGRNPASQDAVRGNVEC